MSITSQDVDWDNIQREAEPDPIEYRIVNYTISNGEVNFAELNKEMDVKDIDITRSLSNLSDSGILREIRREDTEYAEGKYERPSYCIDVNFVDI